ncbi:hypothetical protein ACGFOM_18125 [Streptomyces sp. NPDC048594]|uniref:hypothetical protein n=1 Tax=Streptomyces sp. NPDC048594 TaxID=3365575 RepID=UPI0037206428
MNQQTETPIIIRAKQTDCRVVVEDGRFECKGCGGGFADRDPQKAAREHAEYCAVMPFA